MYKQGLVFNNLNGWYAIIPNQTELKNICMQIND